MQDIMPLLRHFLKLVICWVSILIACAVGSCSIVFELFSCQTCIYTASQLPSVCTCALNITRKQYHTCEAKIGFKLLDMLVNSLCKAILLCTLLHTLLFILFFVGLAQADPTPDRSSK